ncbi:outer membrane efflux protein [Mucilaginibacter paludis DSM 18603]|uniref:Outer membrane efflux protein n=2 Tax=Mucilaginibacter TaxID=423349 RepID=H1Y772_9SPHI|nr:outer membrane efflux protein [Mucilaginibacter paludis DSM 18603]
MNMKCHLYKHICLLLSILATSQITFGQVQLSGPTAVGLSLQQVWEKANQNNKNIQMQQLHVQSSQEDIKDAKAERLPEIDVAGEYARVSNLPIYQDGLFHTPSQYPVLHTYYRVGGDTYLNIYNGHKTNLKIAEQQTVMQIRTEQKNLTVSEIKLRASAYFLDLQRSLIFKQLLQSNITDQEKQLDQIRQLQKNGVVLKSDVLRAELQLSRQKLSLTTIENDIAITNQKLNILIGLPDTTLISPVNAMNLDSLPQQPDEAYLTEANSHAYQNKISEQETNLRHLQLLDVRANVSPKLGLFANYAYSYPQIQFFPYSAALYGLGMAGIRASFPISAFYYNRHKVKASELEYKMQEIEHQDTQDAVRQRVNEAYLRYKEALNRVSVARTNIQQATENSRIVNNTYFNQLSLVTDLLEANTQLLQTRFDMAAAQIAAQMQYYQLQNAIGNF